MKMVAGSLMRERRPSGSERGQGVNRSGKAFAKPGCGGSLTNTQEDGGGSPAGLAKNQRTHAMTTDTRDPALLALTSGEGCARVTGAHSRAMARGVLSRRSQLIVVFDER